MSKSSELLRLAKHVNEEFGRINFSETDDDFDAGVKEGQRMALQGIHESLMGRLDVLLGEEG